jgi:putative permease
MNKGSARVMTLSIVAGFFATMLLATHFLRHTLSALLTALVIAYLLNPLLKYL